MSYKGHTDNMNPITDLIWDIMSLFAMGFKYFGAQAKDAALLSNNDLD